MKQNYMANKIKGLRISLNLTQKQLAEKLNVSDKAVSKWERGLSCPDISLLKSLAGELSITVDELLGANINDTLEVRRPIYPPVIKYKPASKKFIAATLICWGIMLLLSVCFFQFMTDRVYFHLFIFKNINIVLDAVITLLQIAGAAALIAGSLFYIRFKKNKFLILPIVFYLITLVLQVIYFFGKFSISYFFIDWMNFIYVALAAVVSLIVAIALKRQSNFNLIVITSLLSILICWTVVFINPPGKEIEMDMGGNYNVIDNTGDNILNDSNNAINMDEILKDSNAVIKIIDNAENNISDFTKTMSHKKHRILNLNNFLRAFNSSIIRYLTFFAGTAFLGLHLIKNKSGSINKLSDAD